MSQQEVAADRLEKPVVENVLPAGFTMVDITLKGLSFDKPNVKSAVKELCVIPEGWDKTENWDKNFWCTFNNQGYIRFPGLKFGNLSRSFLSLNIAGAEIGEDGALVYFWMKGTKPEMMELADLLSEKYGKPSVKEYQVESELGTKFDKKIFIWVDNQGTQLTVQSIDKENNEGKITIESASRLTKNAQDQLKRKNQAKMNL